MAAKATKTENININIPAIDVKHFDLRIVGDSPLISHAWSEKAKLIMLQNQSKRASSGKEARRPMVEFAESLYWLTEKPDFSKMQDEEIMRAVQEAKFGFPTTAFKAAAVDGAFQQGVIKKKTTARGAFHLIGEFAELEGSPVIREDMVRIGKGTPGNEKADLRYRAEFKEWSTTLHIRYNSGSMSVEQICSLFNFGGFACGVGDWRPAKDGTYGRFHLG